jgi:long-chain fatty acid transport protein
MIKNKLLWLVFITSTNAQAGGFALMTQNASGMGNAYAGAAAEAEDASTIFFNPAGMTYIDGTQMVGAIHLINPSIAFHDKGSLGATGDQGPNAGSLALIPNFYIMTELTPAIKLGLGVSVPFGLTTEYDDHWIGRFQANKSELKTVNINPSIAFKVNDQLSFGLGLSAMRAEATLTRSVNFGLAGEGNVKVEGDDWGFGFNLGAIYQATTDTRIGFAYRSNVKQKLEGKASFIRPALVPNAGAAADGNVIANIDLPETLSASIFSHINAKWDVMADITWTRWSRFQALRILRDNGATLSVTPENWENTLRYAMGVNYRYSDTVKLRAGLAYDEEANSDAFRSARTPANDRTWLTLGAGWQLSPASTMDIGYAHLFMRNARIDNNQLDSGNGRLIGEFKGSVDILSLQYTHLF